MNKREYERAIKDTRKAIYKGKFGDAALGVLRALVAHADTGEVQARLRGTPPPRQLPPANQTKRMKGAKRK